MLTDSSTAPLILVVEDDCNHAELIRRSFVDAPEEYRMEIVDTLHAAKSVMGAQHVDLIVTDVRLPDGFGGDLVAVGNNQCPVIVMTSHGNEQLAVETMKTGAHDYKVKSPEVFEQLPDTVKFALLSWDLSVTRRLVLEANLRAKSDWERTFDAVPDLVSIIDLNHTITRVNKAMADHCGVSPTELIGRKCYEVMHGMSHQHPNCPHTELIQARFESSVVIEGTSVDRVFEISVSPLYTTENILTASVHIARDITSRKQAEKLLLESENKHRKIANEQNVILNAISMGITLIKDRTVLWANPAFERMFGYDPRATFGMETLNLYCDHEAYNTIGDKAYKAIIDGVIYVQDIMMKRRDGSPFWCSLVGHIITPGNIEDGSIWIFHDISGRKRAEEERSQLELQLNHAQKIESIGRLAGGVAHDFNNLLTVILGNVYLSLVDLDPDKALHGYVTSIKTAAEKSAELTKQLLTFARKQAATPKVLDLNEAVTGTLKILPQLIGEDINLMWQPAASLWPIRIDPTQIDQILANLCVNARDSIADVGKIVIRTENCTIDESYFYLDTELVPGEYEFVKLTVNDDGCGMDKETLSKVFEPFFTTKELGKGTGLGLATVYGIVKQNNGFIIVHSEPGLGTSFAIHLPRYIGKEVPAHADSCVKPDQKGLETILLVEDEEATLDVTTMLLTNLGYRVLKAKTTSEAVTLALKYGNEIDLLLSDVVMPEMNGLALSEHLQALRPTLKCLFMSGYASDVISRYGLIEEDLHFISKPFSFPELATKVREVLEDK